MEAHAAVFGTIRDQFEVVLSAIAPAPAEETWQPIETAPHNEEVFLGWFDMDGDWITEVGEGSWGWRNETANNVSFHGSATHWRPLPAPPSLVHAEDGMAHGSATIKSTGASPPTGLALDKERGE